MNPNEFYALLDESDLEVVFTKVNSETRTIRCTANVPEDMKKDRGSATIANLVTVFDIDNHGWRSFYVDRITDVKKLDTKFQYLQG